MQNEIRHVMVPEYLAGESENYLVDNNIWICTFYSLYKQTIIFNESKK